MQLDTSPVKVPGVDIRPGDRNAIWGFLIGVALLLIVWYATRKGDAP